MRHLIFPLLFAAFGCQNPTGLRGLGREIPIAATAAARAPGDTAHIRHAVLGPGGFSIVGHIDTPTPCYSLSAYRIERGTDVAITVVATERNGACVQTTGGFEYTIESPGTCPVHLVIVHHYEPRGIPDTRVFDDSWGCFAPNGLSSYK
jgi:hypothetical protein